MRELSRKYVKREEKRQTVNGFIIQLFHTLQTPGSRETLYRDYVDYCTSRDVVPVNIGDFLQMMEDALEAISGLGVGA